MPLKLLILIVAMLMCWKVESARILAVVPTPSISHQVVFRPVTQELARRGHQVTVITTDPAFPKGQTPDNLTEIDLHDLSYGLWSRMFLNITPTISKVGAYEMMKSAYESFNVIFENQMNSDEVQKILNDRRKVFDLLIVEACVRPALVLSYKYKVPLILFSSFGTVHGSLEAVTGPFHAFLNPGQMQRRVHKLTTWEKIKEIWVQYKFQRVLKELEEPETEMGRKLFGPEVPHITELMNNVDLLFLNVHASWDNNRSVPPSLIYLGGLPQKPGKELPKTLKSYMDSSRKGIIYISFGTNVLTSLLPKDKVNVLFRAISVLPHNVILKWDADKMPGLPENVLMGKWFPQSDLLKHRNVKLFITQGGLQSTDESITAGVPLIGIPMIGDQWYNVEQYVKFGIGVGLDLESLTKADLLEAIHKVIGDESYRQNIACLRRQMYDQPQSSLERAVWWTEYVLRHGGAKHLRSPAANMSLTQYLELDLLSLLLLLVCIILFVIGLTVYNIGNFLRITQKNKIKRY
ncbi:UDP-glycosyltransferase UGT33K1 isoform X1 [Bombyx mori]|uniref:UDP-glucuronosyltransferase n=1 Tax=Bombyx mori TaxID=7091 RepID=G9LPT0_BOMMO|nr:UDP-glycosyltransferase UGT33K1 precursor [Bombyx mori]AEW43153.1 UDP-glycosyltransferase UGT33K1 [Bombyx mori]